MDDRRRSTDPVIFGMAQDLGEVKGMMQSLVASYEEQKKTNRDVDVRLNDLVNTKNNARSALIAGATVAGAVGATGHGIISKILEKLW